MYDSDDDDGVRRSRAHEAIADWARRTVDAWVPPDEEADDTSAANRRDAERADAVRATAADVLSPRRKQLREQNARLALQDAELTRWAQKVSDLSVLVDYFCHDLKTDFEILHKYKTTSSDVAGILLMRRGVVTADAIALLLRHGFTTDAFARWRALYETAVTAAAVAHGPDVEIVAQRYCAHAGLLDRSHPAMTFVELEQRFADNYEWARPLFPSVATKKSTRISAKMVAELVDLASTDFTEEITEANAAAHSDSRTAAELLYEHGPLPFGSDRTAAMIISRASRLTLYELASYSAFLVLHSIPDSALPVCECTEWLTLFGELAGVPSREA